MTLILNLTQHASTPEQGVTDLGGDLLVTLRKALTFDALPTMGDILDRAAIVAELACLARQAAAVKDGQTVYAMIGGAPYLMAPLERELHMVGITPVYAFSTRESTEQTQPDGSVRKVNVFRHAGFVPAAK